MPKYHLNVHLLKFVELIKILRNITNTSKFVFQKDYKEC